MKEKNEELILDVAMKPILKEAIGVVSRLQMLRNNSVFIGEDDGDHFIVTVAPTTVGYLYGVFFEMGRIYEREANNG